MFEKQDVYVDCFEALLPANIHDTRSNCINLSPIRTETEKRFTIYECCKLIREVPDDSLLSQTSMSLKKKYHLITLENY